MAVSNKENHCWIKFLGTAGARFVMIRQLRASGGMWLNLAGKNILIDPGPGSLVKVNSSRPRLDPTKLDAIILTHRHLDHANDINVMIEAMTEGGFKKRGMVFCPQDALGTQSIILEHVQGFPEHIEILKKNKTYHIDEISFDTISSIHPVETYGLKFNAGNITFSLIADTSYFKGMSDFYQAPLIIINTVFLNPRPEVQHLSLEDAKIIIKEIRPKVAILTHFGMTMLVAKPYEIAKQLTKELGIEVISASDGMTFDLSNILD
ncbi:MAG: MBL fold metallo-hydrolase [Candidatus Omnitrophota bacterium]